MKSYALTSEDLLRREDALTERFDFIDCETIGYSVLGRPLKVLRMGTGKNELFISAAHHGNEWITALLAIRFAECFARACALNETLCGEDAAALLGRVRLYLLPLVNPDGMDIANGALDDAHGGHLRELARTQPQTPYPSGWKANYNGTDLNLNYPAGWETAKQNKAKQGVSGSGPRDWVGAYALCEPESMALYTFTRKRDFRMVLAFHTQGEEIYWRYGANDPPMAAIVASRLSAASGYALMETPYASAFAGYKDWFINSFNRPGFTIEAGKGISPLPLRMLDDICRRNIPLMMAALASAAQL